VIEINRAIRTEKTMRTIEEIDTYLDSNLSVNELGLLEAAHSLYMRLCGIVGRSITPVDRLDVDGAAYPQHKQSPEGEPTFKGNDCVTFIACVAGVPTEYCQAWMEKRFLTSILEFSPASGLH
jgi:hypothetical protein